MFGNIFDHLVREHHREGGSQADCLRRSDIKFPQPSCFGNFLPYENVTKVFLLRTWMERAIAFDGGVLHACQSAGRLKL